MSSTLIIIQNTIHIYMYYMRVWYPQRSEELESAIFQELELGIAVNHCVVLGTKAMSSSKATSALNY